MLTCAACLGCLTAACMAAGLMVVPEATVAMAILLATAAVAMSPLPLAAAAFPGMGPWGTASLALLLLLVAATASLQVERFAWDLAAGGETDRRAFRRLVAAAVIVSVAFVATAPVAVAVREW